MTSLERRSMFNSYIYEDNPDARLMDEETLDRMVSLLKGHSYIGSENPSDLDVLSEARKRFFFDSCTKEIEGYSWARVLPVDESSSFNVLLIGRWSIFGDKGIVVRAGFNIEPSISPLSLMVSDNSEDPEEAWFTSESLLIAPRDSQLSGVADYYLDRVTNRILSHQSRISSEIESRA